MEKTQQRAWLSWASVGLLAVLCGLLAILQNRWIQEISRAQRERLQQQLQAELSRLSRDFNTEITRACAGLLPGAAQIEQLGREKAYSAQYSQWRDSHERIFSHIAVAVPQDGSLSLSFLNLDTGQFSPGEWPSTWSGVREQMMARLNGTPFGPITPSDSAIIDLPRFARMERGNDPGAPGGRERGPRFGRMDGGNDPGPPRAREQEWLLLELNLDYVRDAMLPELLQRHLGGGGAGKMDYQAEVVANSDPSKVIFATHDPKDRNFGTADASVNLFDVNYGAFRGARAGDPGFRTRFRDQGGRRFPPPTPPPDEARGRWRLLVRHQAGSLEAVVARARWQNLATSAGLLLLILATITALVRFSRRSQQLAEQQMNFVAGVSHELRTPLTVIRTAAFNLRGKLATRPDHVERYGKLIQDESEKLAALVEQVLRFASARAGHLIRAREPVAMEALIEDGLRSSRAALGGASLVVEKQLEPGLPLVLADELAMKHALQNLIENALKYGTEGNNWIGVFASTVSDENGSAVEVRVADRGPGIPLEEQEHIFEPFFRGQRAVQDQVHGTGLGLNLVKKIVEAHGGTIRVHSEPMKGTEFVVRIPAAPPGLQDEFAHSLG
jgi:signal transduction histidine kinase